jgi:integrase
LGTWGKIRTHVLKADARGKAISHRAIANYRDLDGQVRPVSAVGKTKTAAENNLREKLKRRAKTRGAGDLTALRRFRQAVVLWETKFEELVADGRRSPTSLETHRRHLKNHVLPAMGDVRLGEANTPVVDRVVAAIKRRAGAPTAKSCRSVISGVMGLAVRYGAVDANPVREVDRIEAKAKRSPRALTAEEVSLLRKQLAGDEKAVRADLPDLVTFMLATGVRIGEALAVTWDQVHLEAGRVQITHTIARVKGAGLIRKATKSEAGERDLALPRWAVAMLRVRFAAGVRLDEPIFAAANRGFRDPSNVRRDLREARSPVGGAARRDLGLVLRGARRAARMSRKEAAVALEWPQNRIALIEAGRVRIDRVMATEMLRMFKVPPLSSDTILLLVDEAAQSADTDVLPGSRRTRSVRRPQPCWTRTVRARGRSLISSVSRGHR